jgi:hypothetical protein
MWHVWGEDNPYDILVRKPGRKRPLGRRRHRWYNDINIDLRERMDGKMLTGVIWLREGK